MSESQKRFPYWDFSWRVIGHVLAFLLVPAVLFRMMRPVTSSLTVKTPYLDSSGGHYAGLLRSVLGGGWGSGSPQIGPAFRTSMAEVLLALGVAVLLTWLILAVGEWAKGRPWFGEAAWWVLVPFLLATPVALAPLGLSATGHLLPGSLGCFWKHLGLPAIILALYPATVAARAGLRSDRGMAIPSLLHSAPNMLAWLLILEPFLGIPGAGRLFLQSLTREDWITAFRVAFLMAVLTLAFRLLADVFALLRDRSVEGEGRAVHDGKTWAWGVLVLAVLILVAGMLLRSDWSRAATRTSLAFLVIAPLLFVPGVGWGLLAGELRHKGGKARETLAALVMWPVQIFFALPAFYWVMLSLAVAGEQAPRKVIGVVALFWVFPRLVTVSEEAWRERPHRTGSRLYGWQHGAGMIVSLLAWTAWAGLVGVAVPGFLGMGLAPQEPELGRMISEGWRSGAGWVFPALALVYVPFLWLTIADRVLALLKVGKRSGWIW